MYQESGELSELSDYSPNQSQSQPQPTNNTSTNSTNSHGSSPTTPHVLRSSHHLSRTKSVPMSPGPSVSSTMTVDASVVNAEKQKEIINSTMKISSDFFKTVSYILSTGDQSANEYGQLILYKEQLDLLKASLIDSVRKFL